MLIGPKGAGKTHIGVLVDQHTDITFLRVEPIWLSLQPGEDGWKKVEQIIDTMFKTHEKVMIESLGAGEGFRRFHASLAKKYPIKMIRVFADLDICLARVKNRNSIDHISVSDDKVIEYNQIAAGVTYDWALEIDNNGPAPDADIIQAIRDLENTVGPR
jgi:shikimate kinase